MLFEFITLLALVIYLFSKLNNKITTLNRDVAELQEELRRYQNSVKTTNAKNIVAHKSNGISKTSGVHENNGIHKTSEASGTDAQFDLPFANAESGTASLKAASNSHTQSTADKDDNRHTTSDTVFISLATAKFSAVNAHAKTNASKADSSKARKAKNAAISTPTSTAIEPDERSLPIVTSLFHSIKNWFFGGNLVVRVGVLVLLVGVVLLLRLLSDYIEISIVSKLLAIGGAGLVLAGLGLKLAKNRLTYGITLQGAGLATAYLTTFAYGVYQVLPSLPSFIGLGLLSAVTVGLAVRQNAFPLALLALAGGFVAPILTSDDTGSLVALFSYYLLLNVTIAVIAHYRPWKVLNLFGVTVTFGLAYYWGITENLDTIIESQRWSLVLLVTLHLLLYLFVVIRYAQQIIAYNTANETSLAREGKVNTVNNIDGSQPNNPTYLFPVDTGLLFSVPLLAFGLFSALLHDIDHALTITSAIFATVYLALGWLLTRRSQRNALITEGMLALGLGFSALIIPLALEAEWVAFSWSVQGLALVWFGRRSLRAWSVLFGILLQLISIAMLALNEFFAIQSSPILALTISGISYLATMLILRMSHSPAILVLQANQDGDTQTNIQGASSTADTARTIASSLGVSNAAAYRWLGSINSQSIAFNLVWRSPRLIWFLTLTAVIWALQVLVIDLNQWFEVEQLTTKIALASMVSLAVYWAVNRYQSWTEMTQLARGISLLFYLTLVLQLPQMFEPGMARTSTTWLIFASLIVGWLVVGQVWLRVWYDNTTLSRYDGASWLGSGILVVATAAHYCLPDSAGVMAVLIPVVLIITGLWFGHQQQTPIQTPTQKTSKQGLLYWFDWQQALSVCAAVLSPAALCWVIITNWFYDGVIWNLSYIPLLNLYDITSVLTLCVAACLYYLKQPSDLANIADSDINANTDTNADSDINANNNDAKHTSNVTHAFITNSLLVILGLIGFWLISSMLVRTLHAFISTPLWDAGAWQSEQVQTGLTILWTLLALIATIIASRYWQRVLWFMGIGLLGVVVLKLVLVDLSQTEAIWRVISFLGAGSLILVIGYLAPLPPDSERV